MPSSLSHTPRALFLFPENESIGSHSLHALPWTDGINNPGQPVLVIALNLTSVHAPLIYVHVNRIPIARYTSRVMHEHSLAGQQLPLECDMRHGVSWFDEHICCAAADAVFCAVVGGDWQHVLACAWAGEAPATHSLSARQLQISNHAIPCLCLLRNNRAAHAVPSDFGLGQGWLSLSVSSSHSDVEGLAVNDNCLEILDTIQARDVANVHDTLQNKFCLKNITQTLFPKSHPLQTYASPSIDILSELASNSRNSSCLVSTSPLSLLPPPRPHPLYTCSHPSVRLETLSRYISSRTRLSSNIVPRSRIIKARLRSSSPPFPPNTSLPSPSEFQTLSPSEFQTLSPSEFQTLTQIGSDMPIGTSLPSFFNASSILHHIVVVGDSIDAFFHGKNRKVMHIL
jgi:hypothetical protein